MNVIRKQSALAVLALLASLLAWNGAIAKELVVWHAYRGAERAAFEKSPRCTTPSPPG
jgi:hypothetical protein